MIAISKEVLEGDLFMQCDVPNTSKFRLLPKGFSIRPCKRSELIIWKTIFAQGEYMDFVNDYYDKVYKPYEEIFFRRCMFVVDKDGKPVATSGIWKSYGRINTILGFFVLPEYQRIGIGRGLLSEVIKNANYPVYVHSHPIATTAIKLYSDLGFKFITDPVVGYRKNILQESLSYLKEILPNLQTVKANPDLLEATLLNKIAEF